MAIAAFAPGAAAAPPEAKFEWRMPSRYSGATDDRGRILETQPHDVRRGPWRVYLKVVGRACGFKAKLRWRTGRLPQPEKLGTCRFRLRVPAEGSYRIGLAASVNGEKLRPTEKEIAVRDWLIVAIGDSVASGEGVPETSSLLAPAIWQSARCHRSSRAGFARAARQIEADDGHSSVTFVHLACSGAGVREGLLEPYPGAVPPRDEPALEPQMQALEGIARRRPVDVLLVSAGANDVHFSGIATFCANVPSRDCFARPMPSRFGGDGVRSPSEAVRSDLAALRGAYERLATRLERVPDGRLPPAQVYISQYFDPTRDERGLTCEKFFGAIRGNEVAQARSRILEPLNKAVEAAAEKHGWNLVGEIAASFRRHGYCAGRHAWVSTLEDSLRDLGGIAGRHRGTLHPNRPGHEVIGALVAAELEQDLYPGHDFPLRPFPEPPDPDSGLATGLLVALVVAGLLLGLALAPLTIAFGPPILLAALLWHELDSVAPLLLGAVAGALLLAISRPDRRGRPSRAGGLLDATVSPLLSLLRTVRPLLLPLVVVVAVGAAHEPFELQVVFGAVLVVVAWLAIVVPEAMRSRQEVGKFEQLPAGWVRSFATKIALQSAVAIALGGLLVFVARRVGFLVNPYFEAVGDLASGLLLVALLLWAAAIGMRLLSYATTPLRAVLAFDAFLALVVVAMAFGVVPANEAVREAWPQLATVFGITLLALFLLDVALSVAGATRGARNDSPQPEKRPWTSYVAETGFATATVAAVVLAASMAYGLIDADRKAKPPTPPDEEVAGARPLRASAGEEGLELARRYAPVLAFAADERWSPMRVEPYLAAATLTGQPLQGSSPPPAAKLPTRCPEPGQTRCYQLSIGCAGEDPGTPPTELCQGAAHEKGRLYRTGAVYVRAIERGGKSEGAFAEVGPFRRQLQTLIQYWYFYPYNEWRAPVFAGLLIQRHEGDWEAVTIGLTARGRPLFVADSAHCGGSWRHWREIEVSTRLPGPLTHPLVAVAEGSHANYPSAAEKRSPDWASCARALPSGVATTISYASNIRDRTGYGWLWYPPAEGWIEAAANRAPMNFPGLWGADGDIVLRNFQPNVLSDSEAAPATPSLQPLWRAPVRTIFCGPYEPRQCVGDEDA